MLYSPLKFQITSQPKSADGHVYGRPQPVPHGKGC